MNFPYPARYTCTIARSSEHKYIINAFSVNDDAINSDFNNVIAK